MNANLQLFIVQKSFHRQINLIFSYLCGKLKHTDMILSYITWDVNPVFFSIGSFQVRWYGMCWALGFLFGYLLLGRVYKREKMPSESLDRVLMYMLVSTVIGARIGHCYFY